MAERDQLPADASATAVIVVPDNRPWINIALLVIGAAAFVSVLLAVFVDDSMVGEGGGMPDVAGPFLIAAVLLIIGFAVWLFHQRWVCLDGSRVWVRRRWQSWSTAVDTGDLLLLDVWFHRGNVFGTGAAVIIARLLTPLVHWATRRTGTKPTRSTAIRPPELVLVQKEVGRRYHPRRSHPRGPTSEQVAALKKEKPLRALAVPMAGYSPEQTRSAVADHVASHLASGDYMVTDLARGVMFEHGIHLSATGTVQPVT